MKLHLLIKERGALLKQIHAITSKGAKGITPDMQRKLNALEDRHKGVCDDVYHEEKAWVKLNHGDLACSQWVEQQELENGSKVGKSIQRMKELRGILAKINEELRNFELNIPQG